MNLRTATDDDVESIREVALASLTASYGHAVESDLLSAAVEKWYGASDVGDDVADPDTVCPVAVVDGSVVAFAESYVVDRRERVGEIDWLHVHPDHRESGIGSALLERVEAELRKRDVDSIEGRVLVDNEAGTEFYEREGYDVSGERVVDVGGESFRERIYRKRIGRDAALRAAVYETGDGETVYVDFDESDRGSIAPLYAAYADEAHEERYGYFCGYCESTDVAIDTMDAVQCLNCENRRKPTRWDAAY
ncbi:ribosomal protein S18 acetylase RimI-like enzyme [Halorubrum alkaliphilum]|uniref:Ribosomal protein S18 acetylase RimI-like enzyme n=1 Tax=Halorubrum alkaliphilum TaxID=261290 RepID=A0A8T4GHA8_9EURY|nr:GNAT family N-acetyltransferase [Halorubrum alkaliphilum]MBP1923040.1 ribosomal protein S18 acetylase RimI-like enzyme [Halorubrum alkaliphilum]